MTWEIDPEESAGAEAYRRNYLNPDDIPRQRISIGGFEFWGDGWDEGCGTHRTSISPALCAVQRIAWPAFEGAVWDGVQVPQSYGQPSTALRHRISKTHSVSQLDPFSGQQVTSCSATR
jgi:hypothetical protein